MSSYRIKKYNEDFDLKPILHSNLKDLNQKYFFDRSLSKKTLEQLTFTEALNSITDEHSLCYILTEKKEICGIIVIQKSNWDSKHFGYGIGKYRLVIFNKEVPLQERIRLLKKGNLEATKENIRLVFGRISLNDNPTIYAFEKSGSILTDILVTFHKSIENDAIYSQPKGFVIDPGDSRDENALFEIAKKIFKIDHFHADPYLDKVQCDELYGEWARNSLKGLADQVLVARKGETRLGFITCCLKKNSPDLKIGFIDLVGVDTLYSGEGIGSELVKASLAFFSKYTNSVYVGTQAKNIPAMRLYVRMDFRPVYSEVTFHKWLK